MADSKKGSAVPEDSISPLPEGDAIALAAAINQPSSDIFLDETNIEDWETEKVQLPQFGKHKRNAFYMRHPDESWNKRVVGTIDVGMGTTYVCHPSVVPQLKDHGLVIRKIYTLQDREFDILFAGYKMPDEGGDLDSWNTSAHRIMGEDWASNTWFKMMSMKKLGKYQARRALNQESAPPEWPTDKTFDELFLEAVQDRYIENLEHPVVKTILGAD